MNDFWRKYKVKVKNLRVHGEKVISRRPNIVGLRDYRDAKDLLLEDFGNMCGYCGKNSRIMHERFHIDHFVPQKIDEERKNDYYNLVLACPKCNLTKSDKWPSKDKNVAYNDTVGFVDPAGSEYDDHMERDEAGYIIGKTDLGKQICYNLNFNIRRTDLYWKIQKIYAIQDELEKVQKHLEKDELLFYLKTNEFLKKYIDEAFLAGE